MINDEPTNIKLLIGLKNAAADALFNFENNI